MYELLSGFYHNKQTIDMLFLEKAQSMPTNGVVSAFKYGGQYYAIHCLLKILRIPYTLLTPQKWKNKMIVGKKKSDKALSIHRAQEIFPSFTMKHDGCAEALLIAEYGRLFILNGGNNANGRE